MDDFVRWSAGPGLLGVNALTADLAARLPAGTVVFPRASPPGTARRLVVDVLAFGDAGGQASLDASWTLLDTKALGSAVLARRVERLSAPSAGTGSQGVAADFSQLYGQLSDRIAAGLAASP